MALDNFAFILFKPRLAGNVGAAARALKNMGCRDLRIVQAASVRIAGGREGTYAPQSHGLDDAQKMAVHGRDVLTAATIHPGLDSALADRTLVAGTTARAGLYRSEARP